MKPAQYQLISPDGLPALQRPLNSLTDLVQAAAKFPLKYQRQGYYKDTNMVQLSLEEVAERLSADELPVTVNPHRAYVDYIQQNLWRIGADWQPACFEEFCDSEEYDNALEASAGDPPGSGGPGEWHRIGVVGVDSGQIMITDPCYIGSQWKHDGRDASAPLFKHTDGTLWYCACHGEPADPGGQRFEHFEEVIEKYGKTVNQMLADRVMTKLPPSPPSGEYSYRGCCEATLAEEGYGQLLYEAGHAGAGVVFSPGFGDGGYEVWGRFHTYEDWGRRCAEVRIICIDDSEEDEDDYSEDENEWAEVSDHMRKLCEQTETIPEDWEYMDGPSTGVGVEYWLQHKDGRQAYVCDDQGNITIDLNPK